MKDLTPYTKALPDVGALILRFARVDRATYFEDGIRKESDTDHTVMLSVCACALAEALYKDTLDLGKIAQFAIVHDLVEAYAEDTYTFGISEKGQEEKEEREHKAFLTIKNQFDGVFPWIPSTIEEYERLDTKEARFVKTVDKCMSKVTHILNNGQMFKYRKMDEETMLTNYRIMVDKAREKYAYDFPEVLAIMEELIMEVKRKSYE